MLLDKGFYFTTVKEKRSVIDGMEATINLTTVKD